MKEQDITFPVDEIKRIKHRRRRRSWALSVFLRITGIFVAVAVVVLVSALVLFPVVKISGSAVSSSYSNGDIVLLMKDMNVKRGQFCCIKWNNKLLFKRIIAVGGDTVDIDGNGNVFVNGVYVEEEYVENRELGRCDIELPYRVPEGKLFVLSDVRSDYADSRCDEIGNIEEDQILGVVVGKIWS